MNSSGYTLEIEMSGLANGFDMGVRKCEAK
jgi:hypothetical protein